MANQASLIGALGIIGAGIATEHFFTFSLSSLPTTKRFFSDTEEGKEEVRHSYMIAAVLSFGMSAAMAYYLKSPIPIIVTLILSGIFIYLYERALGGKV